MSIWYSGGNPVGIKSIDVAIAEPEIGLTGNYIKLFTGEDNLEFALSTYNSDYQIGDYVKISVVFESDGDFSGALGTCQGSNYEWVQQDFAYEQEGTYTLTWSAKPSVDMAQIGIWWIGGTAVGVKSINVEIVEQEIGISGNYIALFTESGVYEFAPSIVNPEFIFGDEIVITVTLESDGEFNGCMGTCVGSNYEWKQVEYSSETGLSTWQLQVSPVVDMVQVGIWWIGGTAVGIVDIDIYHTRKGSGHAVISGEIYTATKNGDVYTFNPSDYCDYEEGDTITISVTLNSNDIYNGCLATTDANGAWKTAGFESKGGSITCSLVVAGSKENAEIQFWWMNTKVGLDSITVVKGGELVDTNGSDTFTYNGEIKWRDLTGYEEGDNIEVKVTLSSADYFKGALGMSSVNGTWNQVDFESESGGGTVTCTLKVKDAMQKTPDDLMLGLWWMNGSSVTIDNITVTVTGEDSGEEEQPTDPTKPVDPSQVDTSSWQVAFNGFSKDWQGWQAKNGAAGALEYTATVADIMSINNITDVADLGGILLQIWNVSEAYEGVEVEYTLYINDAEYKKETIAFGYNSDGKFNDYLLQLANTAAFDWGNYAFTGNETLRAVVKLVGAEEGGNEGGDTDDGAVYIKSSDTPNEWNVRTVSVDSNQYGTFEAGDTIKITATVSASDYFNGCIGMNDNSGDWKSSAQLECNGAETEWTWTLENAGNGQLQFQVWWMNPGVDVVTFKNIKIEKVNTEEGGNTEEGVFNVYASDTDKKVCIDPTQYATYVAGDTIKISAKVSASGYFNGCIGMNDNSGDWKSSAQLECNGAETEWTWTLENAGNGQLQFQVWWMNPGVDVVTFKNIKIEKVNTEEGGNTGE